MKMNRRDFLKGIAAFAALVPVSHIKLAGAKARLAEVEPAPSVELITHPEAFNRLYTAVPPMEKQTDMDGWRFTIHPKGGVRVLSPQAQRIMSAVAEDSFYAFDPQDVAEIDWVGDDDEARRLLELYHGGHKDRFTIFAVHLREASYYMYGKWTCGTLTRATFYSPAPPLRELHVELMHPGLVIADHDEDVVAQVQETYLNEF